MTETRAAIVDAAKTLRGNTLKHESQSHFDPANPDDLLMLIADLEAERLELEIKFWGLLNHRKAVEKA